MQHVNCSNEILPEYITSSAVLGLCVVLGVPGNIAVLVTLLPRLKNSNLTTRLMMSLAISDLFTLLSLPPWIWALLHGWTFGSVACKLFSYISYCCMYNGLFSVTLLSAQRYMHVLHHQTWAKLGVSGERGLLCGIWMVSGVWTIYAPVQRELGCNNGQILYCHKHYNNYTEMVAVASMETLLIVLSFSLMVYFYYSLHKGLNELPFFSSNRLTNVLTRIVVAFFIFTVAFPISNILIIVAVALKSENLLRTADLAGKVATSLMTISSCVNPFLYTYSIRDPSTTSHTDVTASP